MWHKFTYIDFLRLHYILSCKVLRKSKLFCGYEHLFWFTTMSFTGTGTDYVTVSDYNSYSFLHSLFYVLVVFPNIFCFQIRSVYVLHTEQQAMLHTQNNSYSCEIWGFRGSEDDDAILQSWWLRQHVSPKRGHLPTSLHGAKTQKNSVIKSYSYCFIYFNVHAFR
jgi:hypothetical protein